MPRFTMPRWYPWVVSLAIVGMVVGAPIWYWKHRHVKLRNFRVVEPGVLYRSGQMTLAGLDKMIHDHGIRTVISLRDGDSRADMAEEAFCAKKGVRFVRIQQKPWWASDGSVPAEEGLREFRRVMQDEDNLPVLVHCFAGHHRTGCYVAVWRIDQGWDNEKAIEEMYHRGYDTIEGDWDVHHYLENYRPGRPVRAFGIQPASRRTGD